MTKKTAKTPVKKRVTKNSVAVFQTGADLRTAVLIVSLLINLFVACLWIALQVTAQYDQALFDFFINR